MICWVAPRGIVAAAVSALFALHLQEIGVPQAEILVPLTFLVIIVTVVLQSMSARWLARALDVAEPDGHGFLIIGANKLGIEIGKALKKQGLRVLLVDSHWENTRKARMDGLPVYFGNAVSEHADRHLDMIGLTGILALSWRDNVNSLACMRYRNEFGVANTYALGSNSDDEAANDLSRYTNLSVGQRLFSAHENFRSLSSRLKEGYAIHSTHLSEEFTFAHWQEQHGDKAIPLFAISKDGQAEVFTTDKTVTPANGDTLISMAMA